MKFSRVCGDQRVMANGGATEGIMPPLSLGVKPRVPMSGLTCSRTPALAWYDARDGERSSVARRAVDLGVSVRILVASQLLGDLSIQFNA